MGKAENIKRAKRLKEAKRKREQDALIAAGAAPEADDTKKRHQLDEIAIKIKQDKVKYSDLLREFVGPIVSPTDNIRHIETKYTFGIHVWNAAIIREEKEASYQSAKNDFLALSPGIPEIGELFDEMAKRKKEEFSAYKNIIADFEIKKIRGDDYQLNVISIPIADLL